MRRVIHHPPPGMHSGSRAPPRRRREMPCIALRDLVADSLFDQRYDNRSTWYASMIFSSIFTFHIPKCDNTFWSVILTARNTYFNKIKAILNKSLNIKAILQPLNTDCSCYDFFMHRFLSWYVWVYMPNKSRNSKFLFIFIEFQNVDIFRYDNLSNLVNYRSLNCIQITYSWTKYAMSVASRWERLVERLADGDAASW